MKISKFLKLHRTLTDQTVKDLAQEIGISESTLRRLESGKSGNGETFILVINWLFLK